MRIAEASDGNHFRRTSSGTATHELILLAQRYERRSTIITSNLAFSEWVKVFGDEKLTTALLDRLTHHAHILTTRGDSYRSNRRKAEADQRAPPTTNPKE